MKAPAGFKREKRDGKYVYVKRLAMGGEVHYSQTEFSAFSKSGIYLGWTGDEEEASYMATKGFTNVAGRDEASDLSLWELWNDAANAGTEFLLAADGEQVLANGESSDSLP